MLMPWCQYQLYVHNFFHRCKALTHPQSFQLLMQQNVISSSVIEPKLVQHSERSTSFTDICSDFGAPKSLIDTISLTILPQHRSFSCRFYLIGPTGQRPRSQRSVLLRGQHTININRMCFSNRQIIRPLKRFVSGIFTLIWRPLRQRDQPES